MYSFERINRSVYLMHLDIHLSADPGARSKKKALAQDWRHSLHSLLFGSLDLAMMMVINPLMESVDSKQIGRMFFFSP
jgi:hypothetical protein